MWNTITRYLPKLSPNNKFSVTQFLHVVSSSLVIQGFGQGELKPEKAKQLSKTLTKQLLYWIIPFLSLRDSFVCLFVIAFLEKCIHGESRLTDLHVIISHLTEEKNASFRYHFFFQGNKIYGDSY